MVAAEAKRRNFDAAQSRAFLGDGGAWIWTLHRTYFPKFEPIVDFVHALAHVYLAAKAAEGSAARGFGSATWAGQRRVGRGESPPSWTSSVRSWRPCRPRGRIPSRPIRTRSSA